MDRIEARLDALEGKVRRYRNAAVVLVGATTDDGIQDVVKTRRLELINESGEATGALYTFRGGGNLVLKNKAGKNVVVAGPVYGTLGGELGIYFKSGHPMLTAKNHPDGYGGIVRLYNKTGEEIVQLRADEYGNGVVGAYNRKGKGRTLQPGP